MTQAKAKPKINNKSPKTYAYCRVSTADQENAKFKAAIEDYAKKHSLGTVEYVEDTVSGAKDWHKRKIAEIIDKCNKGDHIITPELSRLGRSTLDVLEILKETKGKGIVVHDVKANRVLNGDSVEAKIFVTILALVAELERDFISLRTKEAIAARKALGTFKGKISGLEKHKDAIIKDLKAGIGKADLARKYNYSYVGFRRFLVTRGLNDIQPEISKAAKKAQ